MDKPDLTVGERIFLLRAQTSMTFEEIGQEVGISRARAHQIWQAEASKLHMQPVLCEICQALVGESIRPPKHPRCLEHEAIFSLADREEGL